MQFFMPMAKVPTATHQMKGVRIIKGKPHFYEPAQVEAARQKLMASLAPHAPEQPLNGALSLLVKWCFPLARGRRDGQWKHTKPDTDNLQKLLKDCMTDCGFWADDALVCQEITEKFWAAVPGIFVRVETLDDL